MLLGYAAYVRYLILAATQHVVLPAFNTVMFSFDPPRTAVTLIVVVIRTARGNTDQAMARSSGCLMVLWLSLIPLRLRPAVTAAPYCWCRRSSNRRTATRRFAEMPKQLKSSDSLT